ncbi:hypothetical protein N869_00920 [Cellulomonas bogoriensis 69B4 = DSM 16987]|uniref:MFS transporter n=1 Tax=Cellulomonas bogoriensis 69B4 = DSM 16987 TaxID=1386082 RepID=A0A0A0BY72_9CELL|nr:hypothetical protein N869_00920 [Cellulomonas bogoriensis 69B4 = DSM 16987]
MVEVVPPLRFVLGTTFWAWDLPAYAVGAAVGALLLTAVTPAPWASHRPQRPGPVSPTPGR